VGKKRLFSLITDCRDQNATTRVAIAMARELGAQNIVPIGIVGVDNDLEAALNLVDQLGAIREAPGIILVNVAPRNGDAKRWQNGTPFGWLKVEDTFVFGTIGGFTFSLLQKILGRKLVLNVFDLPRAVKRFKLPRAEKEYIISTQFRSFEFLPRAAAAIIKRIKLPTEEWSEVPAAPQAVVWIDNFTNVKTSVLPEEIGFKAEKKISFTANGVTESLTCYNRLKDVPDDTSGLVFGSSGLWVDGINRRFLEIVINGGRAAESFNLANINGKWARIEINSH